MNFFSVAKKMFNTLISHAHRDEGVGETRLLEEAEARSQKRPAIRVRPLGFCEDATHDGDVADALTTSTPQTIVDRLRTPHSQPAVGGGGFHTQTCSRDGEFIASRWNTHSPRTLNPRST